MSEINNTLTRKSWNEIFMNWAIELSNRSSCIKYKTATIISNNSQIVSLGYNGTFCKKEECNDYWYSYWDKLELSKNISFNDWIKTKEFKLLHREWSEENEVHAEINALNWISKKEDTSNYILYTVLSPCNNCAKSIISHGIKTIYYHIEYSRGVNALNLLKKMGIKCYQI
jgi:dCMP deaminase